MLIGVHAMKSTFFEVNILTKLAGAIPEVAGSEDYTLILFLLLVGRDGLRFLKRTVLMHCHDRRINLLSTYTWRADTLTLGNRAFVVDKCRTFATSFRE